MSEVKEKVIIPKVGDVVTCGSCRVFKELVIELTSQGFICENDGLWEGTSEDWVIESSMP